MPDLSTSSRRLFERIRSLLALDDRLLDLPTSHSFPAVILGSFTRDRNTADTCIASPQAPPLLHTNNRFHFLILVYSFVAYRLFPSLLSCPLLLSCIFSRGPLTLCLHPRLTSRHFPTATSRRRKLVRAPILRRRSTPDEAGFILSLSKR